MLQYRDTVTFVTTTLDEYGSESVDLQKAVNGILELGTGVTHGSHQDEVTAVDAIFRPDPADPFIQESFHRLEEMLVIAPLYGDAQEEAWYQVESVVTYRRTLLANNVDNIELRLKKTTGVTGSVS